MIPRGYRARRAHARDIESLARLEAYFPSDRLTRAHWRHLLARGHADVFVVEQKNIVAGNTVVLYRANSKTARLYSLVVDAAHRGRKLGDALVDLAETAARKHRCNAIVLELRPRNRAAQALYLRRGYQVEGKIAAFYEDGAAALRMRKPLG